MTANVPKIGEGWGFRRRNHQMFDLEVHYKKETGKEDETGNNLKVVNE